MRNIIKLIKETGNIRTALYIYNSIKKSADRRVLNYICNNLKRFNLEGLSKISIEQYKSYVSILKCDYNNGWRKEYYISPIQNYIEENDITYLI